MKDIIKQKDRQDQDQDKIGQNGINYDKTRQNRTKQEHFDKCCTTYQYALVDTYLQIDN